MNENLETQVKPNIEGWLRKAVEGLDIMLFKGDLELDKHPYQISWGRCKGSKVIECIQPSDNEEITLDDFFPTTLCINFTHKSDIELLGSLALECIHAFFNEKKHTSKRFKALAAKYYFEKSYKTFNASPMLQDILEQVNQTLIDTYGEFPGKPISFPKKQQQTQKSTYKLFCPECGMELKVKRKMLEKHGMAMPTCACGCKFGCDMEDANEDQEI